MTERDVALVVSIASSFVGLASLHFAAVVGVRPDVDWSTLVSRIATTSILSLHYSLIQGDSQ